MRVYHCVPLVPADAGRHGAVAPARVFAKDTLFKELDGFAFLTSDDVFLQAAECVLLNLHVFLLV